MYGPYLQVILIVIGNTDLCSVMKKIVVKNFVNWKPTKTFFVTSSYNHVAALLLVETVIRYFQMILPPSALYPLPDVYGRYFYLANIICHLCVALSS